MALEVIILYFYIILSVWTDQNWFSSHCDQMSEVDLTVLGIFFGIQLELEIQMQIDLKSLYSIVKFEYLVLVPIRHKQCQMLLL